MNGALRRTLMLVMALTVPLGCEQEEETGTAQLEQSPLSAGEKKAAREVLATFHGGGLQPIDALAVADTIAAEAHRYFADSVTAGSVVVTGQTLDLTSDAVLRQLDIWGSWDPDGGYARFDEPVHDGEGSLSRDEPAYKRARQFVKGSIADCAMVRTVMALDADGVETRRREAFEVTADVEYVETAWHQQRAFVTTIDAGQAVDHAESYSYQSHPLSTRTLKSGGRTDWRETVVDRISGDSGWTVSSATRLDVDLAGTVTLYQPAIANAEPNKRAKKKQTTVEKDQGKTRLVETEQTTVDESTAPVTPYLEETVEVVHTVLTSDVNDKDTGRPVASTVTDHQTSYHRFRPVSGMELDAVYARWSEGVSDFQETVKTVTETTYLYDKKDEGDVEETTVVTEHRYTDNPKTRNDVYAWRSTTSTDVSYTYTDDDGAEHTRIDHGGIAWLTDQIEPDPEIDQRAFSYVGALVRDESESSHYLGDDVAGLKTNGVVAVKERMTATSGSHALTWEGSHEIRSASIKNGAGDGHGNGSDVDGTYDVEVDGRRATLSAEEWVIEVLGAAEGSAPAEGQAGGGQQGG